MKYPAGTWGEFFQKWGFQVNQSVYDEIEALNLSEPSQDLTLLTDDPDWENQPLVIDYSSQETDAEDGSVHNILDEAPETYWHSRWSSEAAEYPHHLTIDMKESTVTNGFTFTQRQNGQRHIKDVELLVSQDNTNWESLGNFTLEETTDPQDLDLEEEETLRYFKILMKSGHDGTEHAALAEIDVF